MRGEGLILAKDMSASRGVVGSNTMLEGRGFLKWFA
jgi:hypothetical protein